MKDQNNKELLIKNLIWFYLTVFPKTTLKDLYINWDSDKILRAYKRPKLNDLELWVSEAKEE